MRSFTHGGKAQSWIIQHSKLSDGRRGNWATNRPAFEFNEQVSELNQDWGISQLTSAGPHTPFQFVQKHYVLFCSFIPANIHMQMIKIFLLQILSLCEQICVFK